MTKARIEDYDTQGVFPLSPNWRDPVRETLSFKTEKFLSRSTGVSQKRIRRSSPRRTFEFSVTPYGPARMLLDNIESGKGLAEWVLPVWHARQSTPNLVPSGAGFVPCITSYYDFQELAVLRGPSVEEHNCELFPIFSVAADPFGGLTPESVLTQDWPAGSRLYPAIRARLVNGSVGRYYTGDKSTKSLTFDSVHANDHPAYVFPSTYLGYPVWEIKPEWSGTRDITIERMGSVVDNDSANPVYFDLPDRVFGNTVVVWTARSLEEHDLQRRVVYALKGQHETLWVPTYIDNFVPTRAVAADSVNLFVQWCGFEQSVGLAEGRRDIRIELRGGTVYYRRIVGFGVGAGSQEEHLILDSLLSASAIEPEQIKMISFLMLSESGSDSFTFEHLTDAHGATVLPLVFRAVTQPPAEEL